MEDTLVEMSSVKSGRQWEGLRDRVLPFTMDNPAEESEDLRAGRDSG